jgi:glycosyltransferase involved in cell wall biosynthesis
MPTLSLCSHCYNDGALLHGLLAGVPAWSRRPDEIILLDDGSAEPFALTAEEEKNLPKVTLIRLPQNTGITNAKHSCYSVATGEVILALDCDSRVSNDFAAVCLELLRDPGIGLVGGMEGKPVHDDYISLYHRAFFPNPPIHGTEERKFIAGIAIALRREVWLETGGYSGYNRSIGEDHYLCGVLLKRGYKLYTDERLAIDQARRLSRHAYCRRLWRWHSPAWLEQFRSKGIPLPEATRFLFEVYSGQCRSIEDNRFSPVMHYFPLLNLCHLLLECCNTLGEQGHLPKGAGEDLERVLTEQLKPCPSLRSLLKTDLLRAGSLPLKAASAPLAVKTRGLNEACDWTPMLDYLGLLRELGALQALEKLGVSAILEEERRMVTDFSGY